MKKTLLLLSCLLACLAPSFASHFAGGSIRYEYTGTGNVYRISLSVYQNCETGAGQILDTDYVTVTSSIAAPSMRALPQVRIDTLDSRLYCSSVVTSCNTQATIYTGAVVHVYSDTITLPPCNNWKISWIGAARNQGILNLSNPGSQNIYVEAFLNNTAAVNSSAFCSNHLPHVVRGQVLNTQPFPVQDVDGDSIAYQLTTPLGGSTYPLSYATGYSATQPLGSAGSASLNQSSQILSIKTPFIGRFALAMKISEYRNGQLIGYSLYDWTVDGSPFATTPTPPAITNLSGLTVNTCPGQPNSITLNFVDSVATDSVFLTVTPPVIAGWTFSNTATAAAGSGSANISWTTPSIANPATLPYFLIKVFAKDNSCPVRGAADYTVLVRLHQCNTDSVWAGDANADFTVNMYDPLAVAVAYGQTGTARTGASTAWVAQYTPDWVGSFITGINMKHADCDGNGAVNNTDLGAITTNYGMVHYRGAHSPQQKNTSVPDLYFDLTGVALKRGTTVTIPVKLGTSALPMGNMYGLATHINVDGINLTTAPTVSYPSGWLGNSSNTLNFTKATSSQDVEWAYARTDHQNIAGNGTIANITFAIPANAPVGQMLHFSFADSRIIDKYGNIITAYNEVNDSAAILSGTSVGTVVNNLTQAAIVPNPSEGNVELQLSFAQSSDVSVNITDISGKVIWSQQKSFPAGAQYLQLPVANLSAGIYLVQVHDVATLQKQVLKWVKH
ncbi:T9SS type A sorting domain-containing protein [Chitinophagaceae bacterium MMS25-I14]